LSASTNPAGYVYEAQHRVHSHPSAPECAERLERLVAYLEECGELQQLMKIESEPIPWDWIAAVHTYQYVETVRRLARTGKSRISADTYLTLASAEAARPAASGAVTATGAVLAGRVKNAFALVRPPGHHANATYAMGYCIFNNIAVAASYALREHQLERVMVVDIDAHHGNGTESIFYANPEVLFVSLHQHP
jgi:acetoin utilization deacetylase AcuC-like enzyme